MQQDNMRGGGNVRAMRARRVGLAVAAAVVALACGPALAVNKCTLPNGAVVYQDTECEAQTKSAQRVKTWDNTPGSYVATGRREVQPDRALAGPPQAAQLIDLYRRWIDAERLALATARVSLAGPVAALQSLQREAEALRPLECLTEAKAGLVKLVGRSTHALLQFMGKEEVSGMAYQWVERGPLIGGFERSIGAARCA